LALGDAAVRPFGVRTADRIKTEDTPADRFGFFSVLDERMDELLITTVVRVHGLLGRAYVHAIHPFDHIVVRRTLLRLYRLLDARIT